MAPAPVSGTEVFEGMWIRFMHQSLHYRDTSIWLFQEFIKKEAPRLSQGEIAAFARNLFQELRIGGQNYRVVDNPSFRHIADWVRGQLERGQITHETRAAIAFGREIAAQSKSIPHLDTVIKVSALNKRLDFVETAMKSRFSLSGQLRHFFQLTRGAANNAITHVGRFAGNAVSAVRGAVSRTDRKTALAAGEGAAGTYVVFNLAADHPRGPIRGTYEAIRATRTVATVAKHPVAAAVIGGTIAFFFNWRGVFGAYAVFSLIPVLFLIVNYKALPSQKHPDSQIFTPYLKLLGSSTSLFTYILILLEGAFIVGSFSYAGAYISKTYGFNNFYIGLIMTGFGIMTVIGGRVSGQVAMKMGARNILGLGLLAAALADFAIYLYGGILPFMIIGVALLGLGFIFTHSTLLTRATEFAQQARGAAMSLVAFCFMGGGGVGTAIGGRIVSAGGLSNLYGIYGIALAVTLGLGLVLIRDQAVETDGVKESIA